MTRVPLEYASERRRRRVPVLAIGLGLMIVVLIGIVFVLVERQRQTQQALLVSKMAEAQLLSQMQVARAAQLQAAATQASATPAEFRLEQRGAHVLEDAKVRVSIGDITGGRVRVSVEDDTGRLLVEARSMRQGDVLQFTGPADASFRLELLELTNLLIGNDFARLRLSPAAPATQATRPAAPELTETQKIDLLLARVAGARNIVFIRNGSEHAPPEAADHLRMKWDQAGGASDSDATALDFIERVATRSSLSGRQYRVRLPDGREITAADWLREQLRQIEEGR